MLVRCLRLFLTLLLGLTATVLAAPPEPLNDRQQAVLNGLARDRYSGRWTELTTNQLADMHRRADAYLTDLRRYHLPGGLVASAEFSDTNRTSVVRYHGIEDSAAWTGFALAAHSFRYAVTRDTQAFEDIRKSLAGVELLLQVSGRPGYLPRFVGPAKDEAYAKFYATWGGADPTRPGFGKLAFQGTGTNSHLVWLGGPSREQYSGVNFGLMWVYLLVQRETAIRARAAGAIELMLERLEQDDGRIDDGQGNRTFVTPLLETTLLRSGATVNATKYRLKFEAKAKDFFDSTTFSPLIRYADYAPNVFNFANLAILSKLEQNNAGRKLMFQERLNQMMRDAEPHLNPFFAGCYAGAFDRLPTGAALTVTLQGVLFEFPAPPRWAASRDHAPQMEERQLLTANDRKWSKLALPIAERPPAPFQWASSPFELSGGAGPLVAHPGVDYLIAFWMGRDATIISSEDAPPPVAAASTRRSGRTAATNAPARATGTNSTPLPRATNAPVRSPTP